MGQALVARIVQQQAQEQVSAAAAEAGVPSNPDAAWWLKFAARAVGVFGAIVALISGFTTVIMSIVSLSPICIVAGLLLMIVAVIVLIFEAPACCSFIKYTQPIAAFAEKRTYIQKAIIYCVSSLITFLLCIGFSMLFGCGLIFASGVVYGIMGIGKKGDRQQMMEAAAADGSRQPAAGPEDSRTGLIYNDDTMAARGPSPAAGQGEPQRWNY